MTKTKITPLADRVLVQPSAAETKTATSSSNALLFSEITDLSGTLPKTCLRLSFIMEPSLFVNVDSNLMV